MSFSFFFFLTFIDCGTLFPLFYYYWPFSFQAFVTLTLVYLYCGYNFVLVGSKMVNVVGECVYWIIEEKKKKEEEEEDKMWNVTIQTE